MHVYTYKSRYPDAFLANLKLFQSFYLPSPVRSFSTFSEYLQQLFVRNSLCYYGRAVETVHVCFDEQAIGLLRKMQILERLQFWLSVFYHFTVVNMYRKS